MIKNQKVRSANCRFTNSEENDYYATDPIAIDKLVEFLDAKKIKLTDTVIEPCVGGGHLAKRLKKFKFDVKPYDIIKRGYPKTQIVDAKEHTFEKGFDFVTNPPFKHGVEILENLLDKADKGTYICMVLKLLFLEGQKKKEFLTKYPPKYVCVFSKRLKCARDGVFDDTTSAVCYAWFIWQKGFKGAPQVHLL